MNYMKDTLGVGETSDTFLVVGNCDIWVSNLTSGTVTLEIQFPGETTWRATPDGVYTTDTWKSIFVSEHGVMARLVGSGNNADVYVRIGRFLNK